MGAFKPSGSSEGHQVLMVLHDTLLTGCGEGMLLFITRSMVGVIDTVCEMEVLNKAPYFRLVLQKPHDFLPTALSERLLVQMGL